MRWIKVEAWVENASSGHRDSKADAWQRQSVQATLTATNGQGHAHSTLEPREWATPAAAMHGSAFSGDRKYPLMHYNNSSARSSAWRATSVPTSIKETQIGRGNCGTAPNHLLDRQRVGRLCCCLELHGGGSDQCRQCSIVVKCSRKPYQRNQVVVVLNVHNHLSKAKRPVSSDSGLRDGALHTDLFGACMHCRNPCQGSGSNRKRRVAGRTATRQSKTAKVD